MILRDLIFSKAWGSLGASLLFYNLFGTLWRSKIAPLRDGFKSQRFSSWRLLFIESFFRQCYGIGGIPYSLFAVSGVRQACELVPFIIRWMVEWTNQWATNANKREKFQLISRRKTHGGYSHPSYFIEFIHYLFRWEIIHYVGLWLMIGIYFKSANCFYDCLNRTILSGKRSINLVSRLFCYRVWSFVPTEESIAILFRRYGLVRFS